MAFQLGAKRQLEVLVHGFPSLGVSLCATGQQSQLRVLPAGNGMDGVSLVLTPLLWTSCTSEFWLWEVYKGYLRCIKIPALRLCRSQKTLPVSSLPLGDAFLSKSLWPELTYLVLLCSIIC